MLSKGILCQDARREIEGEKESALDIERRINKEIVRDIEIDRVSKRSRKRLRREHKKKDNNFFFHFVIPSSFKLHTGMHIFVVLCFSFPLDYSCASAYIPPRVLPA